MFRYQKKYEKVYDSYRLFADMAGSAGAGVCAGVPDRAGPRGTAPAPPETPEPERKEVKRKMWSIRRLIWRTVSLLRRLRYWLRRSLHSKKGV